MTTFLGNHLRVRYAFIAAHTVLTLFLLFFTFFTTWDILFLIYDLCAAGTILVYLLPAFILSLRNRESGYERGWVEVFYITYQILWSWVSLVWLGFVRDPGICSSAGRYRYAYLPFYYPLSGTQGHAGETARLCNLFIVVAVVSAIHTAVLMAWFGWTLWLSTKVAATMGDPWTRDLVLRKISMGKMSKLHLWREGEGEHVGMGKVRTASREEEYRPHKHHKFNGLMA